jgi:hypothetical protein
LYARIWRYNTSGKWTWFHIKRGFEFEYIFESSLHCSYTVVIIVTLGCHRGKEWVGGLGYGKRRKRVGRLRRKEERKWVAWEKKEMRVGLLERFTVRNGFEVFEFFFYFHWIDFILNSN